MCGKLGNNEVESLQNMMSMAVYFVIADVLDVDADALMPGSELKRDLGMTASMQDQLNIAIMEMFDNFHVDFNGVTTIQDIVNQVAKVTIH